MHNARLKFIVNFLVLSLTFISSLKYLAASINVNVDTSLLKKVETVYKVYSGNLEINSDNPQRIGFSKTWLESDFTGTCATVGEYYNAMKSTYAVPPEYRVGVCYSPALVPMDGCKMPGYHPTVEIDGHLMQQVPSINNLYFAILIKPLQNGYLKLDYDGGSISYPFDIADEMNIHGFKNVHYTGLEGITYLNSYGSINVKGQFCKNGIDLSKKEFKGFGVESAAIAYQILLAKTGDLQIGASSSGTMGISFTIYMPNILHLHDFGMRVNFKVSVPELKCNLTSIDNNLTKNIKRNDLENIYFSNKPDVLFYQKHIQLSCNNPYSINLSNRVAVYLSQATGGEGDGYNFPILSDSSGHSIAQRPFAYGVYNKNGVVQIVTSKAPTEFTGHLCDIDPLTLPSKGVAPVHQCPFSVKLLKNPAATAADEAAIKNISTISGTLNFKVAIE